MPNQDVKSPQDIRREEVIKDLQKMFEKKAEAPAIEDTLSKAKAAIEQAAKFKTKQKVRESWHCHFNGCGVPDAEFCENINELDEDGKGHFHVHLEDDIPIGKDGQPLSGKRLKIFEKVRRGKTE